MMSQALQLYLASTSPRRKELLQQMQLVFATLAIDIDETKMEHETAQEFVCRMALEKARAGFQHVQRTQALPVLGADTLVVIDEQIFGKPRDRQHAKEMLLNLSARCHQVMSAVAVVHETGEDVRLNCSQVCLRPLGEAEIDMYWQTGEPQGKAGAYAIQGIAAQFISHLQGSYSSVMGLPLYETVELLGEYGVKFLVPIGD